VNELDSTSNQGTIQPWNEEDIALLHCAVETIGTNKWSLISKEWFDGKWDEYELKTMWDSNKIDFMNHQHYEKNSEELLPNTLIQNISCRRRNEEEAMELRKLFATNSRSEEDMELLYRAYLVGFEGLDKVLRMNAPRRDMNLKISFSSIIVEMKKISRESVNTCKLSILKLTKKLPPLNLPTDTMVSPLRSSYDNLLNRRRFLRFTSTVLPVHDIIMKSVVYCDDKDYKNCADGASEDDLLRFSSPEKVVFPGIL
jgi:hypothetical protein